MARYVVLPLTILALICGGGKSQERTWRAYVELEGRAGSVREVGQGNLFLPLWQDDSRLLFVDMRGQWTDAKTAEGSLGIAYRRLLPSDWIFGLYSFYDARHNRQAGNHQQATFGAELLSVNWGIRLNGHVPDRRVEEVSSLNAAFLQGNNIVVRRGEERAYYGIDFEVERLLWAENENPSSEATNRLHAVFSDLDAELWGTAGVFHFDNDTPGFENMTGPRARVELRLYDLPLLGDDSRLAVSGQYEYDDVRGSIASGMLTVRIPFGTRTSSTRRLSPLDRRMVTPIVRDVDIITNVGLSPVAEPAKFARTGAAISQVVSVDANTANPETAIEGAGADSVAIADGSAGVINTPGTIDLNEGQVLMGGGSQLAVVGCNTGAAATFTAAGMRGTINSGSFINMSGANSACIQGVDLITTGVNAHAILLDDINFLIQDVEITTSGDFARGIFTFGISQFDVRNSTIATGGFQAPGVQSGFALTDISEYRISDSTITTTGFQADGILSLGISRYAVNNSTISTTNSDANGIRSLGTSFYAVNNTNITTSGDGADGIQSFDESVYIVNGGRLTTTGPNARGVNALSTGLTQTFRLNVVEINSSADFGVLMDSATFASGTINATINGSTIVAAFDEMLAAAEGTGIICLNAFGNRLDDGAGTILLNTLASGTINVTEFAPTAAVDLRELDDANRIPFTNIFQFGTPAINFNAGECPSVGPFDLLPLESRLPPSP